VLRFHAQCPWRDENTGKTIFLPALVVPFTSIDDNKFVGIHRVALDLTGLKIGRKMFGVIARAAIKFDQAGDTLAIGEGIETCLAARELGYKPAWALGNAGAISFFPVLEGVKVLQILGERDKANARAIQFCGTRWIGTGRRVRIVMPKNGNDINDALIGQKGL
jgi:hypothetical protein